MTDRIYRRVTMTLCDDCFQGRGGVCQDAKCALWMNRVPDVSLDGNPLVESVAAVVPVGGTWRRNLQRKAAG